MDTGSPVGALLIDLSKAFDTVPHQLLFTGLLDAGCSTDVLALFCNYLTDWVQSVITHELNKDHSLLFDLTMPLLFHNQGRQSVDDAPMCYFLQSSSGQQH